MSLNLEHKIFCIFASSIAKNVENVLLKSFEAKSEMLCKLEPENVTYGPSAAPRRAPAPNAFSSELNFEN